MNVQDYIQEDLCALYVPMLVRVPACLPVCLSVCLPALHCTALHAYIRDKKVCNRNSQVQCKIT